MHFPTLPFRRPAAALAAVCAFAAVAVAPAAAAPVTSTDLGAGTTNTGATITLDSGTYEPGDTITVSGTGYVPQGASSVGPYVALKPDDAAATGWLYGGPDRVAESEAPEDGLPVFDAHADGTFTGTLTIPAGFPAGQHWLRVLAGAFPAANPTQQPVSFKAPFTVADRVTIGYTNTTPEFFAGTTFPATGGPATVKGLGFDANETVAVTLDGAAVTATGTMTDAAGAFTATVTIPALAPGDHTLTLATSTSTESRTIKVVAHAATLLTPAVRPGGLAAVKVSGYVGIAGAGQKVALNLAGTVIACAQADATGSALITATIPSGTTTGSKALNVLAGVRCLAPPVTDPLPRPLSVPGGLTVSDAAPTAGTDALGTTGTSIPVSGTGFAPGEAVTVSVDGVASATTFTASASGTVTAIAPVGSTHGARTVTLTAASGGAATTFTAIAPPSAAVAAPTVTPGGTLGFTLTGWRRADGAGGQKVAVKISAGDILACVQTDADGNGSGSIPVPAGATPGATDLRLLAGTSCVSGGTQDDRPARSLSVPFTIVAAPAGDGGPVVAPPVITTPLTPLTPLTVVAVVTPPAAAKAPKVAKATVAKAKLRIALSGGSGAKATVTVKTTKKVKVSAKARARVVTVASGSTTLKRGTLTLTLTKDGRAALKRYKKLPVVVRVAAGRSVTVKTLTIRAA
jgi:hypothetical protein